MSARAATADVLLPDAWLSRTLGTPAFSLRLPVPSALDAELARLPDPAFCFAKVPEADAASAAALGAAGFRQVDMQVTLERGADPAPVAPGAEVRLAEPEDRDDVLNIAGSCFRFSRFHQDSRIGARTANKLKRAWMANCLDGKRGEEVLSSRSTRGGRPDFSRCFWRRMRPSSTSSPSLQGGSAAASAARWSTPSSGAGEAGPGVCA